MQVTDPVCGMQIESATAAATEVIQGQSYYFCSASCHEKFRADPERYINKEGTVGKGRSCCGCCA